MEDRVCRQRNRGGWVECDLWRSRRGSRGKAEVAVLCTQAMAFNPREIQDAGAKNKPLPEVEQLGRISVAELNEYHCDAARQCLSLYGTVFDVTSKPDKYGKEGDYKGFAGHDITLALGSGKMDPKWLDRFVQMSDKHKRGAQGWVDFYRGEYPVCGTLDRWDEDQSTWPRLSAPEQEQIDTECLLM